MKHYCHKSVFLYEAIQALNIYKTGIYIDATFGMGGHSKLILSKLSKGGRLLAMDRDYLAVQIGKVIADQDVRFNIVHSAFSHIKKYVEQMGWIGLVNGILLDLGLCMLQLYDISRGFSFLRDGPLDMRMDISSGQSASDWLSTATEREIFWVLKKFGEEKFSKKISKSIVMKRKKFPIVRSGILSQLIQDVIPFYNHHKHPATRSFLAFRMYINKELDEITKVLKDSLHVLSPQGRLVVISFHSLEDRIVKKFILQNSNITSILPLKLPLTDSQIISRYQHMCKLKNLGKIVISDREVKKNVHARSAILRYAEKLVI